MSNPNSFEPFFDAISEILSLAKEEQKKGLSKEKLDDSVYEQMDQLEKGVALFRQITEEACKKSGVGEKEIRKTIQNPSKTLGKRESRVLEKAKKMRSELVSMQEEYARAARRMKREEEKKRTSGKKRKKKFKRLGGDGWLPL